MRRFALLLAPVVLLAGCMSDDAPEPVSVDWPGESDGATVVLDLGAGFSVDAPASWTLEQAFELPTEPVEDCDSVHASVDAGPGVFVSFALPAAACAGTADPEPPLNGEHGDYVTVDDAAAPLGTGTAPSDLGEVTTFEQDYEECTQECVTTRDQVALVALSAPVDPDHPTLMIHADAEDVSVERMLALVDAISFE